MVNQQDPQAGAAVSPDSGGVSVNGAVTDRQLHPTDPNRWADGTVRPGNQTARRHGIYAAATARGEAPPDLQVTLEEFESGLLADLGGIDTMPTLKRAWVLRMRDCELMIRLLQTDLMKRGVFTPKGRVRSTYSLLLQTLDRWERYASKLGLERTPRAVSFIDAIRQTPAVGEHGDE